MKKKIQRPFAMDVQNFHTYICILMYILGTTDCDADFDIPANLI